MSSYEKSAASKQNLEEKVEDLEKAVNFYRNCNEGDKAAAVYVRLADIYLQLEQRNNAGCAYAQAGLLFKKSSLSDAKSCLEKAITLFTELEKLSAAAIYSKEMGNLLESDLKIQEAIVWFRKAANFYGRTLDLISEQDCMQKVYHLTTEMFTLSRSIDAPIFRASKPRTKQSKQVIRQETLKMKHLTEDNDEDQQENSDVALFLTSKNGSTMRREINITESARTIISQICNLLGEENGSTIIYLQDDHIKPMAADSDVVCSDFKPIEIYAAHSDFTHDISFELNEEDGVYRDEPNSLKDRLIKLKQYAFLIGANGSSKKHMSMHWALKCTLDSSARGLSIEVMQKAIAQVKQIAPDTGQNKDHEGDYSFQSQATAQVKQTAPDTCQNKDHEAPAGPG